MSSFPSSLFPSRTDALSELATARRYRPQLYRNHDGRFAVFGTKLPAPTDGHEEDQDPLGPLVDKGITSRPDESEGGWDVVDPGTLDFEGVRRAVGSLRKASKVVSSMNDGLGKAQQSESVTREGHHILTGAKLVGTFYKHDMEPLVWHLATAMCNDPTLPEKKSEDVEKLVSDIYTIAKHVRNEWCVDEMMVRKSGGSNEADKNELTSLRKIKSPSQLCATHLSQQDNDTARLAEASAAVGKGDRPFGYLLRKQYDAEGKSIPRNSYKPYPELVRTFACLAQGKGLGTSTSPTQSEPNETPAISSEPIIEGLDGCTFSYRDPQPESNAAPVSSKGSKRSIAGRAKKRRALFVGDQLAETGRTSVLNAHTLARSCNRSKSRREASLTPETHEELQSDVYKVYEPEYPDDRRSTGELTGISIGDEYFDMKRDGDYERAASLLKRIQSTRAGTSDYQDHIV
jgi:hypothetical protein